MRALIAAIIPLVGVGVFWLQYKFPHYSILIWCILIAGALLGMMAAISGALAVSPKWTPRLLWGWVLGVTFFSLLLAVACLFAVVWIGDGIGNSSVTETRNIATALGAAIGVAATAIYTILAKKISYKSIAQRALSARYGSKFPNDTTDAGPGFNAGRTAVTEEGGSIEIPGSWNIAGSEQTTGGKTLVTIEGWKTSAVRVRLHLIRHALTEAASAAVAPAPQTPTGQAPAPPGPSIK